MGCRLLTNGEEGKENLSVSSCLEYVGVTLRKLIKKKSIFSATQDCTLSICLMPSRKTFPHLICSNIDCKVAIQDTTDIVSYTAVVKDMVAVDW